MSTASPSKHFWRDQRGIAAVEFALIAPIMLVTYLSATDLTQALAIDRKLSQVAATVGDLVAQEEEITRAEVQAFFEAGIAIMRPFEFDETKLRLTIVEVDGNSTEVTGTTHRNWLHEGRNGESYDLPDDMMTLADGRYTVVASASYDYEPLFGTVFDASVPLEQRSIHVVRRDVVDFGFPMDGEDDRGGLLDQIIDEVEDVVDDVAGGDDDDDEDDNDCAGNSGGNGRGNNCNDNHNSNGNNGGGNGNGNSGGGNSGDDDDDDDDDDRDEDDRDEGSSGSSWADWFTNFCQRYPRWC